MIKIHVIHKSSIIVFSSLSFICSSTFLSFLFLLSLFLLYLVCFSYSTFEFYEKSKLYEHVMNICCCKYKPNKFEGVLLNALLVLVYITILGLVLSFSVLYHFLFSCTSYSVFIHMLFVLFTFYFNSVYFCN